MAGSAHLDSLDLLKDLRASVIAFAETARIALADAESEIGRTVSWLSGEAQPYWRGQVRKRGERLMRAKDELRQKTLYKTPSGGRASVVDERKAVAAAQRQLEEAQTKLKAVQRWQRQLEQDVLQYRAQVQAIYRTAEDDMPRAAALLDRVMDNLDAYVSVTAPRGAADQVDDDTEASMARPVEVQPDDADGDAAPQDEDEQEREAP